MDTSLQALLQDSAAAARAGRTQDSWRAASRFATEFWLTTAADAPEDLRGEFYALRAASADHLGMTDEAIEALIALRDWARDHLLDGHHGVALVADALLAYISLNMDEGDSVHTLSPPATMLRNLADAFHRFRPSPDSSTLGEDPSLDSLTLDRHLAGSLTQAATTAYTVAQNLSLSDDTCEPLAELFAGYVRRFGAAEPRAADRALWFAQSEWGRGNRAEARRLVTGVLELADVDDVARFEAHDMLGHFCLLELSESAGNNPAGSGNVTAAANERAADVETDLEQDLALHWMTCTSLALDMGAPTLALKKADLAGHILMDYGQAAMATDMLHAILEVTDAVPAGAPAMLDVRLACARSLLETGDTTAAAEMAATVAQWSGFTANEHRTRTAEDIVAFAREQ